MKKIITITCSTLVLAASANAAVELLAGWDFTNNNDSPLTTAANWSDVTGDGVGNSNGTFFADGTNGSSAFVNNGALGSIQTANKNFNLNTKITTRAPGADDQLSTATARSVQFQDGFLNDASGLSFTFMTGGNGDAVTDFVFSYAAGLSSAGASYQIDWSFSTNGVDFTPLDSDIINDANGAVYTLPTVNATASNVWFQGTLPTLGSQSIQIDNVQIYGDVVPEPSTYAAIAGGLVLGLVALHRRRRA